MKPIDIIIRVSRVGGREGDSFISPDVQRKTGLSYCETYGLTVGEVYEELDVSGGTTNRKALQEAIARIESGESGGLLVAKLDRFARNVKEGLETIERIDKAGGRFICVEQQFDTGTAQGRFFLTLMLAFAELERENRKEGFKVAKGEAVGRGVHISAYAPAGYMRTGKGQRLVLDPLTWEHIYNVGMLRLQGESWTRLAEYLDDNGVCTGRGKGWAPNSVSRMLANPVYTGQARNGEYVTEEAHPAIFTKAEYAALNQLVRPRATTGATHAAKTILRKVAKCGTCGNNLVVMVVGKGKVAYGCKLKRNGPACTKGAVILTHRLEEYVERLVQEACDEQTALAEAIEAASRAGEAQRELEEARYSLSQFLGNTKLLAILGEETYNETAAEYQKAVDLAKMSLEAATADAHVQGTLLTGEMLSAWKEGTLEPDERNTLLAALLDRVVVHPGGKKPLEERVQIVLKGNVLLPARSVSVL